MTQQLSDRIARYSNANYFNFNPINRIEPCLLMVKSTDFFLPCFNTFPMMVTTSDGPAIVFWSTSTITSPIRTPICEAIPSGTAPTTIAPLTSFSIENFFLRLLVHLAIGFLRNSGHNETRAILFHSKEQH